MSMAIGHFTFGVGATTGVLMITGLHKKIKNTEPIRVSGGIWAILPDISKLISFLRVLHDSWLADIFWFHRLIDVRIDPPDSVLMSAVLIGFMLVMLIIFWKAVWR